MLRAAQPAKPDISIHDFKGLTADIFIVANWPKTSLRSSLFRFLSGKRESRESRD